MRDYAIASPRFWTGDTGKLLRKLGRDHQVIGFYLFTCASSNMIGLYYLAIPTLCHEVGNITEEGALKVLGSLSEAKYAHYDPASEYVWVTNMAREQLGETLSVKDKRRIGVVRLLEQAKKAPFFKDFMDKYGEAYALNNEASLKPLHSTIKDPSKGKPPRKEDQDLDQDLDQEQEHEHRGFSGGVGGAAGQSIRNELKPPSEQPAHIEYGSEDRWRDITECDVEAYETWLQWRVEEHDVVPPRVRIQDAKFLAGKGSSDQQRAFVDELIRRRFKRLHDPAGVWGLPESARSGPTRVKSADELEAEARARGEDPYAEPGQPGYRAAVPQ